MKLLKEEISKIKDKAYRTTKPYPKCKIYGKLVDAEYHGSWSTLIQKLTIES